MIIIETKAIKVFFINEDFNNLTFKSNCINSKLIIVLPRLSPLNIKWFKDHHEFMDERIVEIRKIIKGVLEI